MIALMQFVCMSKCIIHMHGSVDGAGVEKARGFCPTLKSKSLKHPHSDRLLPRYGEVLFKFSEDYFYLFFVSTFMFSSSGL